MSQKPLTGTGLTVAFSRRTRLPLLLTKLFTSGDLWSHCGVVVEDGQFVVEALAWKGVVKTPVKEWKKRYPRFTFVKIECPYPSIGEAFAVAQIGKGYDYLGMIGAPWRFNWEDPLKWYCSELVESCVRAAGRIRWRGGKRGIRPMECWHCL